MNDRPTEEPFAQARMAINWLMFICQSLATTCQVFLHRQIGERYLGMQSAFAIIVIMGFSLFWPDDDLSPLFWFLAAYLGACFMARVGVLIRRCRGVHVHTFYDGYPRIMRLLPRAEEFKIKRIAEPGIVFFAGTLLLGISRPLGCYLMLAAFGLLVSVGASEAYERSRMLDLNDALMDQRTRGESFRRMNGNNR